MALNRVRQPKREQRFPRMEALHLQGRTNAEIAKELGCSERTVSRDLKAIEARGLERLRRRIQAERAHSFALYRKTQATLWTIVETLMQSDDHKSAVPAIRAIVDAEKAVNGLLDDFADAADAGSATITDLVAQFSDEDLDDVTPEQIRAWDAASKATSVTAYDQPSQ